MVEVPIELVEQVNSEHLIQTDLRPADLLFVFGTREGVDEFVGEASALWRAGYFKRAIISGGVTPGSSFSEAQVIFERMVEAGVPREAILLEDRAQNTGENVIYSLPILDSEIGLNNIVSLIAMGKLCTSRRYLMTLERHWPDVEKMLVAVNWFGVPREEWHLHAHSRKRVLSEFHKIEPYMEKGFIVEWPKRSTNSGTA